MNENMLLKNKLAADLFALSCDLPIIDWHNHLSVADIAGNRKYGNMAELWVKSDPYKHRAMRICGVPEQYITGNASDFEKFRAWSETLPGLAGNPLYHWSEMELKRVFGIDKPLNGDTADEIWNIANEKLQEDRCSAAGLLKSFKVEYAAPCVLLCDDVSCFSGGSMPSGIVPSLRGDDVMACGSGVISDLSAAVGSALNSWGDFCAAVSVRLSALHKAGCRFADHALDAGFGYDFSDGREEEHFSALLAGTADSGEKRMVSSAVLRFMAGEYARMGWTMQLHIGACRNTSSRLRSIAGPAGGYAGIGQTCDMLALTGMLDEIEKGAYGLPRVILYTLNPADNAAFTVLTGSYSQDGVAAKVQAGPAWWFCDHVFGMRQCFENCAAFGVLSTFVGMTTDSRSLLSFVRHEYFRRVFCAWLADKAEAGEMPDDFDILAKIVLGVCYGNAKRIVEQN